jgi:hypothetical protein
MAYSANKDARVIPINDYGVEVPSGALRGHSSINKFGRNTAVASGGTEEIWDGSAAYSYPATALMTSISQTADQVAMRGATIEIQGLDANWALVTQNATLDGTLTTTVVTLTTPLIRCFRMKVQANVVSDSPIRVHNAGETQDYAIISIGYNQTQMAVYTTPASTKAYVTNYYAAHNPTVGQTFTSNEIAVWGRDNANSYEKQLKHSFGVPADGHFQHRFYPYYAFGEKTDIFITSSPVSAAADVSAGFDLILVQDEY